MKKFSIVVAVDEKMGIGRANTLPWRLSGDMQRFKDVTVPAPDGKVNAVVMGRKTWESLPLKYRPLPGRLNVVLSSQEALVLPEGVLLAASFENALTLLDRRVDIADMFIIGGGVVFAEAMKHKDCHRIYLTRVLGDFSCDVFFPVISSSFKQMGASVVHEEAGIHFQFCDLSSDSIPLSK